MTSNVLATFIVCRRDRRLGSKVWDRPTLASQNGIRAKILTVSDSVQDGTRQDRSGDDLAASLARHGFVVVERRVVADGVASVAAALSDLSHMFAGLLVTTGGTGFSPTDLTPEATRSVMEREAPGLAEAMRSISPLGRLAWRRRDDRSLPGPQRPPDHPRAPSNHSRQWPMSSGMRSTCWTVAAPIDPPVACVHSLPMVRASRQTIAAP